MAIKIQTIPLTDRIKDKLMDKIDIHDISSRDAEADRAMDALAEHLAELAYKKLY